MHEDDLGSLGQAIRQAREQAGLSIGQLAAHVGVHKSTIGHIETGRNRHPAGELLQRIAEVCQIEPSELLQHIGIKPSSILPKPRDYLLRALGTTEEEADFLDHLIKYELNKLRREEPRAETDQERHDRSD